MRKYIVGLLVVIFLFVGVNNIHCGEYLKIGVPRDQVLNGSFTRSVPLKIVKGKDVGGRENYVGSNKEHNLFMQVIGDKDNISVACLNIFGQERMQFIVSASAGILFLADLDSDFWLKGDKPTMYSEAVISVVSSGMQKVVTFGNKRLTISYNKSLRWLTLYVSHKDKGKHRKQPPSFKTKEGIVASLLR